MFERINKYILKCAVIVATKKPAPTRIPLTGENALKNDCFVVEVQATDGDKTDFQVDLVSKKGFCGRLKTLNEQGRTEYSVKACVPLKSLEKWEFEANHFYKTYRFRYRSPFKFIVWNAFSLFKLEILKEKISQLFFNISTKERTERIEVLTELVSMRAEMTDDILLGFVKDQHQSSFELFRKFYGEKVFGNPQYKMMLYRFEMILRSFLDGGEISETRNGFQVEPKALALISQYQEENRRHKEQMAHNRRIFALSIVVAIATIMQAYTAFFAKN